MRPTNLDIFIYLRKSRKDVEQEEKEGSDTLDRHRRFLLELVRKENHNLIKEPFEEVVSGEYISERPKIMELLKEVEQGAVDAVLVMDLDRLGRGDMFDMGSIYRAFSYSETLVLTPSDVIDPSSESAELMFGVKSIVSREELKSINKRLQNGRRASAREGKFIARLAPYGYKVNKEELKLYPDPDTAPVVKTIFKLITEGMSRRKVVEYLEGTLNVASPGDSNKKVWDETTISYIVKNEVYLGRNIWGKTKQYKRNGKKVIKHLPREQWIIRDNCHEPLVDEKTFIKAINMHKSGYRPPTRHNLQLSNPLAGLIKCSHCGRSLRQSRTNDRPNPQLRCINRLCQPYQKGALLYLIYDAVINNLTAILSSIEVQADLIDKEKNSVSRIPDLKKAISKAEKELVKLNEQKNNLHDLLEQGVYSIETFLERQQTILVKSKELEEIIKEINIEIKSESEKELHYSTYLPRAKIVLEEINKTDDATQKNQLLKTVIEKIIFTREKDWIKKDQFKLDIHLKI